MDLYAQGKNMNGAFAILYKAVSLYLSDFCGHLDLGILIISEDLDLIAKFPFDFVFNWDYMPRVQSYHLEKLKWKTHDFLPTFLPWYGQLIGIILKISIID